MTVERVKLAKVVDVKGGKRLPAGASFSSAPTAYPYIRGQDIRGGRIRAGEQLYITEAVFEKIRRYTVKGGDVCVTIVGNIGDVGVTPPELDGANLTENAVKLIPTTSKLDSRFLAYALLSPEAQQQMKLSAAGAAQAKLGIYKVNEIEIPFPGVERQRRIASILSAYDDLIENNTRRIAILEEMARRIYEEWFVRFRFPGHEGMRMLESELGLVPEGWRMRALGDLVDDIRDGVNPDAVAPETPYVGLEHIPRRSIALAEWGQAADVGSTKLRFREGDILFGKIRPYFHKVAVAPVAGVASSDAIVIRAKQAQDFGLALAVASSDAFVAHATQTSNGTKMPRANWGVLRQYPVPTPPQALHERFEELMAGVVSAVANHVLRNRNLRTTRDLLLPKLISGELDVSAMPEPQALAA